MTCALCVKHASPTTSDGTCAHEHITAVGEAIGRRVNVEREVVLARQHAWENGGREAWLAAHDYPRCEHGLHTLAICEDCATAQAAEADELGAHHYEMEQTRGLG